MEVLIKHHKGSHILHAGQRTNLKITKGGEKECAKEHVTL